MKIETRCIEFIPHSERYGAPRRLFTIWFASNMQVTGLVVGTLGISQGLNLSSTILAIVLGNALGSIFMAAHSAQGPHLGVPQMIQSRAQFGVYGAALPLFVVVLTYILFSAANAILMRDTIKTLVPMSDSNAIFALGIATLVISIIGYEILHKLAAVMSVVSTLTFAAACGKLIYVANLRGIAIWGPISVSSTGFWLEVAEATSWSLGFCTLVADYSRYLPKNVSTRATFLYSYLGNSLGASSVMVLGAFLSVVTPFDSSNPGMAIASLFATGQIWVLVVILVGITENNAMNFYSAFMAIVTIFTGFRGMTTFGRPMKIAALLLVFIVTSLIGVRTQYRFGAFFSDILSAQIYVLVPWSSINLVDYYFLRKGRYVVDEFYRAQGRYGRVNVIAFLAFALGVLFEVPCMSMSFFKGPVAEWLGFDMAFFPALFLPGAFYGYLMKRRLAAERQLTSAALAVE